jgi:hypothetical protein
MRIEHGRIALAILLTLTVAACRTPEPSFVGAGMDMFAPVSVRLHKLSRIVSATPATATATATAPATRTSASAPATGPSALEALIELNDQFADPGKSPGIVTLALYDQPPLTHKGDLINSWTYSLSTPEENRDHWDRTLRMYKFKLPLIQPLPKREHVLLTVSLVLPNGMELTDELELPVK